MRTLTAFVCAGACWYGRNGFTRRLLAADRAAGNARPGEQLLTEGKSDVTSTAELHSRHALMHILEGCLSLLLCRSVLAWRKWFHKQGHSGYWQQIGREATPAPDLTREQLLDRYHQHTKNCPACSKVCNSHWKSC